VEVLKPDPYFNVSNYGFIFSLLDQPLVRKVFIIPSFRDFYAIFLKIL